MIELLKPGKRKCDIEGCNKTVKPTRKYCSTACYRKTSTFKTRGTIIYDKPYGR